MNSDFLQDSLTRSRTIVLTGAGISKSAGIPTFEEFPELREVLTLEYFQQHYFEFWHTLKQLKKRVEGKNPTVAHTLLASKKNWLIVTMNIDSLHQKAGTEKLIEVHGNLEKVVCTNCCHKHPFEVVYDNIYCKDCGGRLKPMVALYGEDVKLYNIVMQEIKLYSDVLIIGTSFKTNFADQFRIAAEKLKKRIHIFNTDADEELMEYLIEYESSNYFL